MKHTIGMKKYVIDQILLLIIYCAIFSSLIYMEDGHIVVIAIFLIGLLPCISLCQQTLLLPLDMLCGEVERTVYFSKMIMGYGYEFSKKYYCEWRFYSSKGMLEVIVPVALTEDEMRTMERPQVDQKVKVRYYRFSKLLRSWKVV